MQMGLQEFGTSAATFALLCASALFGRFIHRRMPETYRTRETLETMQLVIGMLVTFAALVLGLLTASVKNSYDAATRDRHAYALHLTALDQCLRDYGPETRSAREDLARYTAAVIASTWPHEPPPVGIAYPDTRNMPVVGSSPVLGDIMNRIGQRIRALTPTTREKTATAEDCQDLYHGVIAARMTVIEDAGTELSVPFFSILIFWLTVVFFTLGLAAPRNRIAALGILLCALSLSSAVYVIIDLSLPYSGFMAISSGEMRNALTEMMAPGQ